MGRDKALLPWRGGSLAAHIAGIVKEAAGVVTVVGREAEYPGYRGRILPDLHPGLGPLGGLETALTDSGAEWNLVVACDMPRLTADWLAAVLSTARRSGSAGCVIPIAAGRAHPLAAAYHRKCLPRVTEIVFDRSLRLLDAVERLEPEFLAVPPEAEACFANMNTPEDWAILLQSEERGR